MQQCEEYLMIVKLELKHIKQNIISIDSSKAKILSTIEKSESFNDHHIDHGLDMNGLELTTGDSDQK